MVLLIFKYGIFLAVKISELIQRNSPPPSPDLSESLISPPQIFPLPSATNSASLSVSGFAVANQTVEIHINESETKIFDVNSEGKFEGIISLSLGINDIYAITKTKKGAFSPSSQPWSIFYSSLPPSLEILEPSNNAVIKKTNKAEIKGKAEKTSKVSVNDHQVIVDNNGLFSFPVILQTGENKFKIICTDPATNETEQELTLYYQP